MLQIDLWQIPLLVMASMVVLEPVVRAMTRRWNAPIAVKRTRTLALGMLFGVLLVILVMLLFAVGISRVSQIATIAAALCAAATLWLTLQSYRDLKAAKHETTQTTPHE